MSDFSLYALRPFSTVKGESPLRAPIISRPPPRTEEDAERGFVIIKGGQAQVINLAHSMSSTTSRPVVKETKRTYDEVRIFNPANPEQYVDVKRPTKITTAPEQAGVRGGAPSQKTIYAKQPETNTIQIISTDNEEKNPEYHPEDSLGPGEV